MNGPAMGEMALRELQATVDRLRGCTPAQFDQPTALPRWSIEDLARHLVGTAARQAEAFHRVNFSVTTPPGDATVVGSGVALVDALAAAADHLAAGVRSVEDDSDGLVPLPWASLPPVLAAFVILVEYGVHRYDLDVAFDGSGALAEDVALAIVELLPLMLLSLAAPAPPPVEAIRFEPGDRAPSILRWHEGSWSAQDDAEVPTVIRGSHEAVALFVLGRIGFDDPRLDLDDPAGALAGFKVMFPGP